MHSKQDIENAARLVPEHVCAWPHNGESVIDVLDGSRRWQPWADTEAGSHDWAVLDTAARLWIHDNGHILSNEERISLLETLHFAGNSGVLVQRKAATFAAAAAIGAHMARSGQEI